MHVDWPKLFSFSPAKFIFSHQIFIKSYCWNLCLTCVLLYSLKGLYKGTCTLPKQHKRRSGIRFYLVVFRFAHRHMESVRPWWHTAALHLHIQTRWRLFVHHMSAIVSVQGCMRDPENVCPDMDLSLLILDVFSLPRCLSTRRVSVLWSRFHLKNGKLNVWHPGCID